MGFWGWFWFLSVTVFAIMLIVGMWQMYKKADYPGWWSIIPILNVYGWVKIANREWWWTILYFIPIVGVVIWIITCLDIAKLFGRSVVFGIFLIIFPYIWAMILGFGPDYYRGIPRGGTEPKPAPTF